MGSSGPRPGPNSHLISFRYQILKTEGSPEGFSEDSRRCLWFFCSLFLVLLRVCKHYSLVRLDIAGF